MFCSKCGNQVNPGDNVCTRCGAPLMGNSGIQGNVNYNQNPNPNNNLNMNYNSNPNMNPNMNYNANPNMNPNMHMQSMNPASGNGVDVLKIIAWCLIGLAAFYVISFFFMAHIKPKAFGMTESVTIFETIGKTDGECGVFSLIACIVGTCIGVFFIFKGIMKLLINDRSMCSTLSKAFIGIGIAKIIQLIDTWVIGGKINSGREVHINVTPVLTIILSILAIVIIIAVPFLEDRFY